MPVRRRSPAVLAYVALAVVQLVMVLIIGGGGISVPGVILAVALFGYLSVGKPFAWWILLVMNSLGLTAIVVVVLLHIVRGSGHLLWRNDIVLFITTLGMEVALLSPAMRRHVASRGLRLAPRRS